MPSRVPMLLMIASLSGIAACASTPSAPAGEREAVLATFDSWNEGWKTKDATLAVADYAEDVDWTNAFGDRFESRDALRAGLEFIFGLDFVMAGSSAADEYRDVTFLDDDIAIVRSQLIRKGQETETGEVMKDRQINHLRVLRKKNGQWRIVSHLISQAKEKGSL